MQSDGCISDQMVPLGDQMVKYVIGQFPGCSMLASQPQGCGFECHFQPNPPFVIFFLFKIYNNFYHF